MKYDPIHYQDYLNLDQLLTTQKRRSEEFSKPAHDEWLFITVHQVYELWFFQIIKEMKSLSLIFNQDFLPERDMGTVKHRLSRVLMIMKNLTTPLDILETMTPLDFLEFRDFLYPASGFQSAQFRIIETMLGLKESQRHQFQNTPFYDHLKEPMRSEVIELLKGPSFYERLESWLARTPFLKTDSFDFWKEYKKSLIELYNEDLSVIESNPRLTEIEKQKSKTMISEFLVQVDQVFDETSYKALVEKGVFKLNFKAFHAALFISLYRDEPVLQTPFNILSILMDIDESLTTWRYRHSLMAHRMLGRKIGTGGSSGTDYLKNTADKHKVFVDLFNLSSYLIPRNKLPKVNISYPTT